MANAEMMAKANEKRMNALEKKLDAFEKDFRKSGDMTAVIKRVSTLEAAVKALAATTKGAGATDRDVKGEVKELERRLEKREKELESFRNDGSPESAKKIKALENRKDTLEKTILAVRGRSDRDAKALDAKVKAQEQEYKKMADEQKAMGKKIVEAAMLESRLKILEGQVRAALSR